MRPLHLVVIEGQHGAGKTAQTDALAKALRDAGLDAQAWHHATPADATTPFSAALVYAHQRAELCAWAGREGPEILVADRWWHSTEIVGWTLEGAARNALFRLVSAEKAALPSPLRVAVLDAPDGQLDARIGARGQAVTAVDHACRPWYRDATVLQPWCATVVDTAGDIGATTRRLTGIVLAELGRLDDAMDLWHAAETALSAHEWLGMSWDAYRAGITPKRGPR